MTAVKDIAIMRLDRSGLADFTFGAKPRFITGRERVAQHFMLTLLTRPGALWKLPGYGGGLMTNTPETMQDEGEFDVAVASAVSKALRDVLVEQNKHPLEPADRLVSATIIEGRWEPAERTYYLKVELRTETGETILVSL